MAAARVKEYALTVPFSGSSRGRHIEKAHISRCTEMGRVGVARLR